MGAFHAIAASCAALNLQKAARAATQIYNRAFRDSGLRITQFVILVAIARLESPSLTMAARALRMDRTTLTRGVGPLQRAGLVRVKVGKDRRTRCMDLTPVGRSLLEQLLPTWQMAQSEVAERIGEEEFKDTMSRVIALTSVLSDPATPKAALTSESHSRGGE